MGVLPRLKEDTESSVERRYAAAKALRPLLDAGQRDLASDLYLRLGRGIRIRLDVVDLGADLSLLVLGESSKLHHLRTRSVSDDVDGTIILCRDTYLGVLCDAGPMPNVGSKRVLPAAAPEIRSCVFCLCDCTGRFLHGFPLRR